MLLFQSFMTCFHVYDVCMINNKLNIIYMIGPSFKFVEVASADNSVAEEIDMKTGKIKQHLKGSLHFLIEVSSGMLLLQLHPFMQGINPNDQIIYDTKDPNFKLILCINSQSKDSWLVKVNQNPQLLLQILSERCRLVQRKAANVMSSKIKQNNVDESGEVPGEKNQSTQKKLIESSKRMGNLLRYAGGLISKGFQKLGNYFSKKIQAGETIYLSDRTKDIVDKSLKNSGKLYQFTQEQFANLFNMGKTQTQKLLNTQKGQQLQQTGPYNTLKDSLQTGLQVVFNVYDGYNDGVSEALHGFGKGSTEVMKVKYGQEVADANYDVVHAARNVYKITKVPKQQLLKTFNPNNEKEKNPPK